MWSAARDWFGDQSMAQKRKLHLSEVWKVFFLFSLFFFMRVLFDIPSLVLKDTERKKGPLCVTSTSFYVSSICPA